MVSGGTTLAYRGLALICTAWWARSSGDNRSMVALKTIKANGWTLDPEVPALTIVSCQSSEWGPISCGQPVQGLNSIGKEALGALSRVYPEVAVTRLHPCPWLAGDSRCQVHLKMECEQVIHYCPFSCLQVGESLVGDYSCASSCLQVEDSSIGQRASPICLLHGCR